MHSAEHYCWDFNAMANASQKCTGRLDFLKEVQEAFQKEGEKLFFEETYEARTCDKHWQKWISLVQRVVLK